MAQVTTAALTATRALSPAERHWPHIQTVVLSAILLLGIASRCLYVDRPFDPRTLAPWREADYTQIARNFYREGLNIFYPRIDWRGDSPGYAEMEFPVTPWLAAVLYRLGGYNEVLLRLISAVWSVLGLLVFVALSRRLLPPGSALFATAAFALNPLLIYLGSAMQPDPFMLFLLMLAVLLIWRWEERPSGGGLVAAGAVTGLAVLAKSPAACVALLLGYAVLRRRRWRAFRDAWVYLAAVVTVLPPLAWYLWAAHFWRRYGNSLGVSNESHFLGLDMLLPPRFLLGIVKWEVVEAFTPCGLVLAGAALLAGRRFERALGWYALVWAFYLISARTSGDNWAFYYHCLSVPPACLLMGAGIAALWQRGEILGMSARRLVPVLAAGTLVAQVIITAVLLQRRDSRTMYADMQSCAMQFQRDVPAAGRIVVLGGAMRDEYGQPVAHNQSMFFAWMDRKGFNYGVEELSADTLDRLAARGGRYWIVGADELASGTLRQTVMRRYRLIDECARGYGLYDLAAQAEGRMRDGP